MRMFLTRLVCALLRPFSFRGKGFLIHQLAPRQGIYPFRVQGYEIDLDLRCLIQRGIFFGIYETTETHWVEQTLKTGMTFVDVGANVGYFTLMASALVGPEGRVLAFEPNPTLAERLRKTLARNDIHNVVLVQKAVSDRSGSAQLYFPTSTDGIENASLFTFGLENSTEVEVTTLDQTLSEHRIVQVDLLKLDVEGLEPNVLRGGAESIGKGKIQHLICEFNDHWLAQNQSSPSLLFQQILDLGFQAKSGGITRRSLQNVYFDYSPGAQPEN